MSTIFLPKSRTIVLEILSVILLIILLILVHMSLLKSHDLELNLAPMMNMFINGMRVHVRFDFHWNVNDNLLVTRFRRTPRTVEQEKREINGENYLKHKNHFSHQIHHKTFTCYQITINHLVNLYEENRSSIHCQTVRFYLNRVIKTSPVLYKKCVESQPNSHVSSLLSVFDVGISVWFLRTNHNFMIKFACKTKVSIRSIRRLSTNYQSN